MKTFSRALAESDYQVVDEFSNSGRSDNKANVSKIMPQLQAPSALRYFYYIQFICQKKYNYYSLSYLYTVIIQCCDSKHFL